ncbi:MAG: ABC transporter ATP-binding protein [Betaproteobacteria bacterium]|nr:ABC transporter ATP-binding protein [Betaproteobacteria bacterium]
MISLRSVSKAFGAPVSRTVLRETSLEVARGEYVAVMGESGTGKSTLLNLIAGLERPDTGTIVVADVDFDGLHDDALTALRRERMGFVFQAFHVLPYLSVRENVGLPLALLGLRGPAAADRVARILAEVALGDRGNSMPRELSGGELQRVAIARALVHRPAIVLADEPTGNLDPNAAAQVVKLLRDSIKAQGATGVLVTHSRAAAASADRILALRADGLHESARDALEP